MEYKVSGAKNHKLVQIVFAWTWCETFLTPIYYNKTAVNSSQMKNVGGSLFYFGYLYVSGVSSKIDAMKNKIKIEYLKLYLPASSLVATRFLLLQSTNK